MITKKDLIAAGIAPEHWASVRRQFKPRPAPARLPCKLLGGPLDGAEVFLADPLTGTAPLASGGRYSYLRCTGPLPHLGVSLLRWEPR